MFTSTQYTYNTNVKTVADLRDLSESFDQNKADYTMRLSDVTFDSDCLLTYNGNGNGNITNLFGSRQVAVAVDPLALTPHALSQVCQKLNYPPYAYMNQCPADLRATNLNYWITRAFIRGNPSWFVRTYNAENPTARAVLSTRYSPIDSTTVLDIAFGLLGDVPHRIIRPYVDPDILHLKISVADDKSGNYAIGAYISNGETGNRALMVTPFIQRHSCDNSIILNSKEAFSQRHVHVSTAYLRGTLKEKLGQTFRMSAELIDEIVTAEFDNIPDVGKVIADLCKDKGLSQDTHDLILMGTENQSSRMGIVNGLSFAAKQMDSVDKAIALETMAGDYLLNPRQRARTITAED
jgi:hypothetical protein